MAKKFFTGRASNTNTNNRLTSGAARHAHAGNLRAFPVGTPVVGSGTGTKMRGFPTNKPSVLSRIEGGGVVKNKANRAAPPKNGGASDLRSRLNGGGASARVVRIVKAEGGGADDLRSRLAAGGARVARAQAGRGGGRLAGRIAVPVPAVAGARSAGRGGNARVAETLRGLGLGKYAALFAREEIDVAAARALTDGDLKSMGIPLGPRLKILSAKF